MGKPEIGSKRVISVSSFTLHSCHARPPSGPPPPIAASIAPRTILSVSLAVKRSEEHTSELQSLRHLVCRLLLEKTANYASENYYSFFRPWRGVFQTETRISAARVPSGGTRADDSPAFRKAFRPTVVFFVGPAGSAPAPISP